MIPLFTWNESFLTHLPLIDEQHRRLVNLINDLGELAMSSDETEPQAFVAMHNAILDYAATHFEDEEALMAEARVDPRHFDRHRAEHQSFIGETQSLAQVGDDISPAQARALVEYLVHWLAYHILGIDQSMARQVRAITTGQSPAQAFKNDILYIQSGTEPLLAAMSGLFQIVSKRNRELHTLNRELEQRVRQRTLQLEEANRQLQRLSTHDDLTGLPNRRFAVLTLSQHLAEAQRYGKPLSVLMLDADHFKGVNDRFGHAEGDALLRTLAARLRHAVRTSDIVCRLGGDEFLVICPLSSLTNAAVVAETILAAQEPFCTADGVVCWDGAVSIGIAEAGRAMAGPEDLLRAADEALYAAKRQGGARLAVSQKS